MVWLSELWVWPDTIGYMHKIIYPRQFMFSKYCTRLSFYYVGDLRLQWQWLWLWHFVYFMNALVQIVISVVGLWWKIQRNPSKLFKWMLKVFIVQDNWMYNPKIRLNILIAMGSMSSTKSKRCPFLHPRYSIHMIIMKILSEYITSTISFDTLSLFTIIHTIHSLQRINIKHLKPKPVVKHERKWAHN